MLKVTQAESYLFARKAMRSGSTGVRKQLWETRFSLLLHETTVGHSEKVHSVPIQRAAHQLPMVIHSARRAKDLGRAMGKNETTQGKIEKQSECACVCCTCLESVEQHWGSSCQAAPASPGIHHKKRGSRRKNRWWPL